MVGLGVVNNEMGNSPNQFLINMDRQDLMYRIRTALPVNHLSIPTQNPVYPVYPCLNPFPPWASRAAGICGRRV